MNNVNNDGGGNQFNHPPILFNWLNDEGLNPNEINSELAGLLYSRHRVGPGNRLDIEIRLQRIVQSELGAMPLNLEQFEPRDL